MNPHKTALDAFLQGGTIDRLSFADLKRLRAAVLEQIKRRFKNPRQPKYGGLNRGFTDAELEQFFAACTDYQAATMFRLQLYLGLRAGEVVRLRLADLDLERRHLYLETEKARQPDCLYLHDEALRVILAWLRNTRPADRLFSYNTHALGKHFRRASRSFNRTYGASDCDRPRSLNRLTTHSFRHTFIRRCWNATHDQMLVMRLARHRKFQSTQTYLQVQQEEMDAAIVRAFRPELYIS